MGKVTYLLGAGASAGALPTIEGFEKGIVDILRELRIKIEEIQRGTYNNSYHEVFSKAYIDLEFLISGCREHKTVDTFAKMLFATAKDIEYKRAKCSIILFFELFQFFYPRIDKRYDAFFASIVNRDEPRLPKDINIISWNYDYEFEKAFMKYAKDGARDVKEIYKELNVVHKNSPNSISLSNRFGIIKVNGTIGFYSSDGLTLGLGINASKNGDFHALADILTRYKDYCTSESHTPAISFAWEEDQEKRIQSELESALGRCEALVVIGYSFPTFNRDIDISIISEIEDYSTRVYVQDKDYYKIKHKISQHFQYTNPIEINIEEENNLDEFFIPHELKR